MQPRHCDGGSGRGRGHGERRRRDNRRGKGANVAPGRADSGFCRGASSSRADVCAQTSGAPVLSDALVSEGAPDGAPTIARTASSVSAPEALRSTIGRGTRAMAPLTDPWSLYAPLARADERELLETSALSSMEVAENLEAQADELTALLAIYEREVRVVDGRTTEDAGRAADATAGACASSPCLLELSVPIDAPDGTGGFGSGDAAKPVASVVVPPDLRGLPTLSGLVCDPEGVLALTTLPPLR